MKIKKEKREKSCKLSSKIEGKQTHFDLMHLGKTSTDWKLGVGKRLRRRKKKRKCLDSRASLADQFVFCLFKNRLIWEIIDKV